MLVSRPKAAELRGSALQTRGRLGPGGDNVPHIASTLGVKDDPGFQKAYWSAFEKTFGDQNAHMVKVMLLSKVKTAETGSAEIDRVCQGLRMTMGWLAEAIERSALQEAGFGTAGRDSPKEPPKKSVVVK